MQDPAIDERLLREALLVIRSARDRAPTDFIFALAVVLGGMAAVLAAIGFLVDGVMRDLSLNLAAEVAGALLTVVLVDGLWDRQQTGAAERLGRLETALRARISHPTDEPMSRGEHEAWQAFVAEYRELTRRETLLDRLRAARGYGRRAQALERQGESLLGLEI
ncbi:MAG: hypothetical protein ACJ761_07135 [Chloroflexota bacterium]